ncbi:TolB family protein [Engelhardtia mirabilis]|uniref:Protein TolB n=1 Tax=Engelhardtia mirabilis TaxID=2528011 RepID=A0A518BRS7_9BACT|nr:Protein TolB [Planctomycetes bacterium Pla133]QDV03986.1 Protein TolB [Planctomycetes bacterium Pla86]
MSFSPAASSALAALALSATSAAQLPSVTELISVDAGSGPSNFSSWTPAISGDGSIVVYLSGASDLVAGDTNGVDDIFVHDRGTGITKRASVSSSGAQANGKSSRCTISRDGRYVAFESAATNLVDDDTNGDPDVFRHDLVTGATIMLSRNLGGEIADQGASWVALDADGSVATFSTLSTNFAPADPTGRDIYVRDFGAGTLERITIGLGGQQVDNNCYDPVLSDDGRFVAFTSQASNLVPGDTNGSPDVFVFDRVLGTLERVSVGPLGQQAASDSQGPSISADGRFVAFQSRASVGFTGDTNGAFDVFLRDRLAGTTIRVSTALDGDAGSGISHDPSISADGRFVAFGSWAKDLVVGDVGGFYDVFVFDRQNGVNTRRSPAQSGSEANNHSKTPALSADGRTVVFESVATNLAGPDTNGWQDIYLHEFALAPAPTLVGNGVGGFLDLAAGAPLTVSASLDPGDYFFTPAEWWVWAETPFGNFWLTPSLAWLPSALPVPTLWAPIVPLGPTSILTGALLPAGAYTFRFGLDLGLDAQLAPLWSDSLEVTVGP